MTSNDQNIFWESIPSALRNAVELTVPPKLLQARLSLSKPPSDLATRYTQLEFLLKDDISHDEQVISDHDKTPASPHPSPLFPLALLYTETLNYAAAEEIWRTFLSIPHASGPGLAAMSNLIEVLISQHKYPEAEKLSKELLPLLQRELGENSPQALGCMRKLMLSLIGQGKREEAKGVYQNGIELAATIEDDGLKKDEEEAMQEMAEKIESVV